MNELLQVRDSSRPWPPMAGRNPIRRHRHALPEREKRRSPRRC